MATIEERDALRQRLLDALYAQHEARQHRSLDWNSWADAEGLDRDEVQRAGRWLVDHALAIFPSLGPMIEISSLGIDEVEDRLRPRAPTDAPDGNREIGIAVFRQLEIVVAEVRTFVDEHEDQLDRDDAEDLRAQADTIEAQSRSPRPRTAVIMAALQAIMWVANNAAAGVIGGGAFAATTKLAQTLGLS